ncbi:MAG TPA: catalase-related domain-containing protein, partial [Luteimonas sp.]|nr:catalase-related domain-containing protein [Luteimonas sp.]
KCPFANQQRDGHMQMQQPKGRVNYEPSSLDPTSARETSAGFRSFAEPAAEAAKGRIRYETFADHYSQARLFFRSQTPIEQAHLASALVFELSKVETPHVREAIVGHLRNIDDDLAQRVANGLGMAKLPPARKAAADVLDLPPSPALQIIGKMKPTLEGRAVGILIDDGSDATVITALRKAIEGAGATVKLIAPKVGGAVLSDRRKQAADGQLAGTPSVLFDAVALVLSDDAGKRLAGEAAAVDFVRDAFGHLKAIATTAGAQAVLTAAGIAKDAGVVDAGNTKAFVKAAMTRQWAREPTLRTLA